MCVHYGCMLGDSAALTSGVVATTPPAQRGATMAVYSFSGFTAAFLAPLVFGVVLDLAGGNQSAHGVGARIREHRYLRHARASGAIDLSARRQECLTLWRAFCSYVG